MSVFELDDDGYPTEATIEAVRTYTGPVLEFFEKLNVVWHLASWGWKRSVGYRNIARRKRITRFYISTAGWSGNEELIGAMEDNFILWHLCYVQHRVGGHYIFEAEKDAVVHVAVALPRVCDKCAALQEQQTAAL